jgi:hypothetical protein
MPKADIKANSLFVKVIFAKIRLLLTTKRCLFLSQRIINFSDERPLNLHQIFPDNDLAVKMSSCALDPNFICQRGVIGRN